MRAVDTSGIVIERVRLLIRQVGATIPEGAGRQRRIADRIGISPSMLSKLTGEGKKVSVRDTTIKEILDALDLDPAFFFDEALGAEPDYRDHIRRKAPEPSGPPPLWPEFAAQWHRFGELSGAERAGLQAMARTAGLELRDWTDWIAPAEWVLARRRG